MNSAVSTSYWLDRLETILRRKPHSTSFALLDAVAALGREMGAKAGEALLQQHPSLFEFAPGLEAEFYEYAVASEDREVRRIRSMQLSSPVAYRDIMDDKVRNTYNRVSDIFDWLDFTACERFVMIGCGQLPVSALHVHDRTRVGEVICVDVRPDAVADVEFLAGKLGMDNLGALVCDGKDFDYRDAQIVYVANMVKGKTAVVARILETAPDGVRIVVRSPAGLGRLWTQGLGDIAGLGLTVARRGHVGRYLARDELLAVSCQDAPKTC